MTSAVEQQVAGRLIEALDVLARDEAAAVATVDFVALADVQDRAAVVIERLAPLTDAVVAGGHRNRLEAVQEVRSRNARQLEVQLASLQDNLREAAVTQRRIGQVAPAYGRATAPGGRSRLSITG